MASISSVSVPSVSVAAATTTVVAAKPKQMYPKINITTSSDWKWIILSILGTTSIIATGLLIKQWHYAVIGRSISNDVIRFLEYHGSKRSHGVIQGGILTVPMTVGKATTVVVARVLGIVDRIIRKEQVGDKKKRGEAEESAETTTPEESTGGDDGGDDDGPVVGTPGLVYPANPQQGTTEGNPAKRSPQPAPNQPLFEPVDSRKVSTETTSAPTDFSYHPYTPRSMSETPPPPPPPAVSAR